MPIYKFKSLEEASRALWNTAPDAEYFKQIRALFDLAMRLSPPTRVRPGVSKFRSLEDARRSRHDER